MTYDFMIWDPVVFEPQQARSLYREIGQGLNVLEQSIGVQLFLADLDLAFPGSRLLPVPRSALLPLPIDTSYSADELTPRHDRSEPRPTDCPWATSAVGSSACHTLSLSFSGVRAALPIVRSVAARFRLAMYDPQASEVWHEGKRLALESDREIKQIVKLTITYNNGLAGCFLEIEGWKVAEEGAIPRVEAHILAAKLAHGKRLSYYHYVDPESTTSKFAARMVAGPSTNYDRIYNVRRKQ